MPMCNKWASINTAPKDGTWVVLGKSNWRVFPKARWELIDEGDATFAAWVFEDDTSPCLVPNVDGGHILGWQEDIDEGWMPTHWMPVPPEGEQA